MVKDDRPEAYPTSIVWRFFVRRGGVVIAAPQTLDLLLHPVDLPVAAQQAHRHLRHHVVELVDAAIQMRELFLQRNDCRVAQPATAS